MAPFATRHRSASTPCLLYHRLNLAALRPIRQEEGGWHGRDGIYSGGGQHPVASDSVSQVPEHYVRQLFEQFKDTHYERILVVAFARGLDLAEVMLSDQIPKGQRSFSESDVRDFIGRFDKQEMHV